MTLSGLLNSAISRSSLLDPSFSLYNNYCDSFHSCHDNGVYNIYMHTCAVRKCHIDSIGCIQDRYGRFTLPLYNTAFTYMHH